MNPGINNPQGYHQYQNYMKQIPDLLELDWMNIDDNSYMNQGQNSSQPKRDLFGTSSNSSNTVVNPPSYNSNMFSSMNQNATQVQPQKPKMGLFDNMPSSAPKSISLSNCFLSSLSLFLFLVDHILQVLSFDAVIIVSPS